MRWRPTLSVGVIVALAVGIWAAVSAGGEPDVAATPTTTTGAVTTTTAATTSTTTTTTVATTTTAVATSTTVGAEARLLEVEAILEDLYFRWFDAIYRDDETAVRQVIATEENLEAFRNATTDLDLPSPPTPELIDIVSIEILRDDPTCLVTFSEFDLTTWRGEGAVSTGVNVLLKHEGRWKLASAWTHRNDLWQDDCLIQPGL